MSAALKEMVRQMEETNPKDDAMQMIRCEKENDK
jgi:hypothetical protein